MAKECRLDGRGQLGDVVKGGEATNLGSIQPDVTQPVALEPFGARVELAVDSSSIRRRTNELAGLCVRNESASTADVCDVVAGRNRAGGGGHTKDEWTLVICHHAGCSRAFGSPLILHAVEAAIASRHLPSIA